MNFKQILFVLTLVTPIFANGADGNIFTDALFSPEDFEKVNEDIVASFAHTSHIGAASLGEYLGIEIGLVAGIVQTEGTKEVSARIAGEDSEIEYLPSAGLVASVTTLYGLGGEVNLIPKIDEIDGAEFESFSLAGRWTITDMFPIGGKEHPFNLAIRASIGDASLSYEQSGFETGIGNYTEVATFDVTITEFTVLAGLDYGWVEPYISVGVLKGDGDMRAEGTNDGPIPILPVEYKDDFEGTRFVGGILFKLPLLRTGFEYSQIENSKRLTAKLSFKL